ncbi:hypothetical protein BG000_010863 [Podila horticola]|nr:hypothetical protein BG000_010863 [Podila horticola]
MSTIPLFSTLPAELQSQILFCLPQRDLSRCALVSKSWNSLATPALWKAFEVTDGHSFDLFMKPGRQEGFTKNARFIQVLVIRNPRTLKWFVKPGNDQFVTDFDPSSDSAPSWVCICQNQTRLTLGGCFADINFMDEPILSNVEMLDSVPYFSDREIMALHQEWVSCVINSNPGIRMLSLKVNHKNIEQFLSILSAKNLSLLEEIYLVPMPFFCWLHRVDPYALKSFLEDLPESIQSISLAFAVDQAPKSLSVDHPHAENIDMSSLLPSADECEEQRNISCRTFFSVVARNVFETYGTAHLLVDKLFEHIRTLETPAMDVLSMKTESQHTDRDIARVASRSFSWKSIDLENQ